MLAWPLRRRHCRPATGSSSADSERSGRQRTGPHLGLQRRSRRPDSSLLIRIDLHGALMHMPSKWQIFFSRKDSKWQSRSFKANVAEKLIFFLYLFCGKCQCSF
uniref:Uncharacterized protein n=1 Tax=Arundo donax TaxID=35708 RepID=A0A0A9G2Y1_ARUDO